MTDDPIVLGGLAGIAANVFKEALTWSFYFLGWVRYTFVHFCAGLVVNPGGYAKEPLSLVIGVMIDYTIAAVFGILMYLVMQKTGKGHWFIKGLGFGMGVFMICYGLLRPTFSLRIESTPVAVLFYIIPNLAYGVVTCWFLKRYGKIQADRS